MMAVCCIREMKVVGVDCERGSSGLFCGTRVTIILIYGMFVGGLFV